MSGEYLAAAAAILWLGVLATISPCPLGTNVAAVTLIAGGGGTPRSALLVAGAYGAGRMAAHMLIGVAVMKGIASAPRLMVVLQSVFAKFTGPVFMVLGVVLLGWVGLRVPKGAAKLKKAVLANRAFGVPRMFGIGCLFSLIPCPETAALFFGGMVPIAVKFGSTFAFPAVFGLGTALPVMLIGGLLSIGVGRLASDLGKIRSVEGVLRAVTGGGFIAFGLYLTLDNVYYLF